MVTNTNTRPWVERLEPDLACFLRGHIFPHHVTHEMQSTYTLRKVRGIRKLILTFLYLMLLSSPTSAFPSQKMDKPKTVLIEHNDLITVRTTGCKPLTPEELKARMGIAFDESRMKVDDVNSDERNDVNKRGSSSRNSVINKRQKDKNEDFLENYFKDESDIDDIGDTDEDVSTISVQNRKFMRRKRDVNGFREDFTDIDDVDSDNTNSMDDKQFLYQNWLFHTISKRKSRQKRSSSRKNEFHPAWECDIKTFWKPMREGYFPKYIRDGMCTKKTCFFGLYRCKPVKYKIKLLQRDPENACRPVPLIGETTAYEESWIIGEYSATVACECGLKNGRSSGKRNKTKKNRKRGRNE